MQKFNVIKPIEFKETLLFILINPIICYGLNFFSSFLFMTWCIIIILFGFYEILNKGISAVLFVNDSEISLNVFYKTYSIDISNIKTIGVYNYFSEEYTILKESNFDNFTSCNKHIFISTNNHDNYKLDTANTNSTFIHFVYDDDIYRALKNILKDSISITNISETP